MNFDERYPESITSVAQACWADNSELLRHLLANGHGVDAHDNQGWFPLHVAASLGSPTCLGLVLDAMAATGDSLSIDVDVVTYDGVTALMLAAGAPSLACVRRLTEAGADPTLRSMSGWSALHAAARSGHLPLVDTLLEYGAAQLETLGAAGNLVPPLETGDGAYPLLSAALEGGAGMTVLERLMDAGASLSCREDAGSTPLMLAAQLQRCDAVELFCRRGLTPQVVNMREAGGRTALHLAMGPHPADARANIITTLLCCGADVSPEPLRSLLLHAAAENDALAFSLLLDAVGIEALRGWQQGFLWNVLFGAGLGFVEVLLRHGLTHDEVEFVARDAGSSPSYCQNVLGPVLLHNYTRRDTLLALRLLQDDECRRVTLDEPDSLISNAIDHLRIVPMELDDRQPSLFCVRRVWRLLEHVHSLMTCDPCDWGRLFAVASRLQTVVGSVVCVFAVVRAFAEFPLDEFVQATFGTCLPRPEGPAGGAAPPPTPEEVRALERGRLLLQIGLHASGTRLSCDVGHWLRLPDELVQPPALAVIARAAIHAQVRRTVRSRYVTRPAKMAAELRRVAELLPAGLRPTLLLEDAEMRRRLAAMLDVSPGSAWAPAEPDERLEEQPDWSGLGHAAATGYARLMKLVTAWEHSDGSLG
ncbi:ankyrin-2-like isoform X2 [Pollicipes pollicipes]|uniref:ankyrin-2-like isoform X2 n=1 Tax=Pollicipes pollicipes TaxID=41117 RepID=UPI001884C00A|nr:ankyrin-2-like isoform X2 [Pollicipes pollicipes]XP_037091978.1 ankyrin-2-like isoform X2 [Pollicipes pollicipes]XP_037091979.1 ankyrin-2-like isoform X2 [Pollicipes pollicipes]